MDLRVCFFKQKAAYEIKEFDWSSDMCSSDLLPRAFPSSNTSILGPAREPLKGLQFRRIRSEERRVGKEGRSRWSPYQYKKRENLTDSTNGKRARPWQVPDAELRDWGV